MPTIPDGYFTRDGHAVARLDARCVKCGSTFGWVGTVVETPACPSCGHVDRRDRSGDQARLDEFRLQLAMLDERRRLAAAVPVAHKVEYVMRQGQTRDHRCHWPGCQNQVPPAMWGCRRHWLRLPKRLRDAIWAAYVPGQEVDGTPSDAYLEAAAVREWIEAEAARG